MPRFVTVLSQSDVPDHAARTVSVGGERVAVFRVGSNFYAIGDACPCAGASLAKGTVDDDQVECCVHGYRYSLTSGAAVYPPRSEPVPAFKVRVQDRQVQIDLDREQVGAAAATPVRSPKRCGSSRNCSACGNRNKGVC